MKTFYLTTAIDYVNSRPHVGTAYEKICADAIARFQRMRRGGGVYFAMGTDEHSLNVQKEAERQKLSPRDYSDKMAAAFEETWAALGIQYDTFIRTTEVRHEKAVQAMFAAIHAKGDIYKGVYRGLYCSSCEAFLQEKDLVDGKCPNHKTVPQQIEEENYFFKLSDYRDALLEHVETNPQFVRPDARRNEIINVLKGGLEDISVSRASATWGIPLPIDETQVVYVWFDALINYLSAVGYPDERYREHWPADLHIIGKDITRFHCIIWPAMLMAAGLELPKSIFGHGFISVNGQKLSKSLGNVIDPASIVERFGADALRYFLLREITWGGDGDFSWEQLERRYNAELANDLGNLLSRSASMVARYLGGTAAPGAGTGDGRERTLGEVVGVAVTEATAAWERLDFNEALNAAWTIVRRANQAIEEEAPWKLAKDESKKAELQTLLYDLLESLRNVALLVFPAMPGKTQQIWERLGQGGKLDEIVAADQLGWRDSSRFENISPAAPLFPKSV